MNNTCESNKVIERCKKKLLEGTNIESSPEEMAVLDNILFRFWQMGWLDKDTNVTTADCISRQAAIKAVSKGCGELRGVFGRCEENILALPSAQPGWIPCTPETMPHDYQWYYATCKSLVDNRENWVIEGCYMPWEHFDSTPMIKCGDAEVIAWMPKEFPEPWKGENV